MKCGVSYLLLTDVGVTAHLTHNLGFDRTVVGEANAGVIFSAKYHCITGQGVSSVSKGLILWSVLLLVSFSNVFEFVKRPTLMSEGPYLS